MSWKEELNNYELYKSRDLDDLSEESTSAKTDDVGFVNSKSGAGIIGRDNGDLEGFADYGLGFRFNRKRQSLMIFAPNLQIFSTNIKKHDKIEKESYFRDELKEIENLLQEGDDQS